MTPTRVELLTDVSAIDSAAALADWAWLLKGSFRPLALTRFCDWFIERPDGSVEFLDMLEGTLRRIAPSLAEWHAMLDTIEGRELLLAEMVELMYEKGAVLRPGECFGYRVPPIAGGAIDSANVTTYKVEFYASVQGQLHSQLRANSA